MPTLRRRRWRRVRRERQILRCARDDNGYPPPNGRGRPARILTTAVLFLPPANTRSYSLRMSLMVLLAAMMQATNMDDPALVVRRVQRAVENDSLAAVTSPWRRPAAQNDRGAAFGLATAARLSYDYAIADRLYEQVIAGRAGTPDRWSVFARLG